MWLGKVSPRHDPNGLTGPQHKRTDLSAPIYFFPLENTLVQLSPLGEAGVLRIFNITLILRLMKQMMQFKYSFFSLRVYAPLTGSIGRSFASVHALLQINFMSSIIVSPPA